MFAKKLLALVLIATTVFAAPLVEDCMDVTVFFARGTFEPGTLGIFVGPELQHDLQTALGPKSLTFTGIEYPADLAGSTAGGDPGGAQRMLDSVSSTAKFCPDTKIVMSGYSQGAQLVHLALAHLSAEDQKHVAAVVTFGDPYRDRVLPGDLESCRDTFCAEGDIICGGIPTILPPHLSYWKDTPAAAEFIAARV